MKLTIFLEGNPIEYLQRACTDLARYMERSTGAEIEVIASPEEDGDSGIWIGRTPAAESIEEIESLDHDGYFLWSDGNKLVICGRTPDGTVNGIYSFLQEYLGVRWFAPGPLFEFVPRIEDFRIPVAQKTQKPTFPFRMYSGIPGRWGADWSRRNRMDRSRPEFPFGAFGHNLFKLFPSDELAEEHPDVYCLIDGERLTEQTSHRGQPCFSNPKAVRIAVDRIRSYFDSHPDSKAYSISVNDNLDFCQCERCRSFGVKVFRGRAIHSNVYFDFVSKVAGQILESHPDRYLGALAYWGVVLPPDEIDRLPSNVVIFLTQDTSQHHDDDYMERDRAIFSEWSSKCSNLIKYDYYGLGWLTPRYFPRIAADDLSFLSKKGGAGLYSEAYPLWPNIAPQLYLVAQLLWNIERDPDELLAEFLALFTPVEKEIREFYGTLEKSWLGERPGRWFEGFTDLPAELRVMSLQDANAAWRLISEAYSKSSGRCRERVGFLKCGFELSYRLIRGYHLAREIRVLPLSQREDLTASLPVLPEMCESVVMTDRIHESCIKHDDLYPDVYFKDERYERKISTWKGIIHSSELNWITQALEVIGSDPTVWKEVGCEVPSLVHLALRLDGCDSQNLMPNPGFEEGKLPTTSKVEVRKWIRGGRDTSVRPDKSLSRSGKRSLRVESEGRGRISFILPIEGGNSYLVESWGYADPDNNDNPRIEIAFMEDASDYPGEVTSRDVFLARGQWERSICVADAPKGSHLLCLHFMSRGEDEVFWLDDLSIRSFPPASVD